MADAPIGISFIPSVQNQAAGPQSLRTDGGTGAGSTDLAAAYKILSLRLPQVVGAQAPTPQTNLTSAGSAGLQNLPGGMDPHAALFQAFIKSILGGSPDVSNLFGAGSGGGSDASASAGTAGGVDVGSVSGAGSSTGGGDAGGGARVAPKITFPQSTMQDASADTSAASSNGGYDAPTRQPDNSSFGGGYY